MPEQLRLLPPSRPLSERFAREFFLGIPKQPGVYLMQNSQGRIVYIGKAKNLRNRLCSYRYVKPGSASKKVIRLVHEVEQISWELTASDLDAQLRENYLLRTHRPKFNRANVYPQAYCFLGLQQTGNVAELVITRELLEGFNHFGAFKNTVLFAVAALRRLLWALEFGSFAMGRMPASHLRERMVGRSNFRFNSELAGQVKNYLSGKDPDLLTSFDSYQKEVTSAFELQFITRDYELLQDFFVRAASRNRELKEQFGIAEETISKVQLNDLLLQARFNV